MAELIALVGLVSSTIQLVDFGTKIVSRLNEYQSNVRGVPKAFRDIKTELPLLLDTLERTKKQAESGHFSETTQRALLPVVDGCSLQLKLLDDTLVKTLPTISDSPWRRGVKAFSSVGQEKKVQQTATTLRNYVQTLIYHQTAGFAKLEHKISEPALMVPFDRDSKFVGRTGIFTEIGHKLRTQRRVALAGIGGVGKSQIAIEYCYRFRDEYPEAQVFWVHASNALRFDQAYKDIARKLSLPGWNGPKANTLQLVFEWLSDECNGCWLLILDNADDVEIFFGTGLGASSHGREQTTPLVSYLPRSSNGSIIITTRDKRVGEKLMSNREKPIVVPPLTVQEADTMLRSKLSEDEWSELHSNELLNTLEYLPLAITQAAAFISENCITLAGYLEALRAGDSDMKDLLSQDLEDSRRDLDAKNSVFRTWKLSFDQITKQKPHAAEILSLMAVLDRQGIPKTLLRRKDASETESTTALGTLQAFSLISTEKGGENFEIHRLVQLSTQKWLQLQGTITHWQEEALRVLLEAFPVGDYENWETCEALSRHVEVVVGYTFKRESSLLQRAAILDRAASYHKHRGRHKVAEEMQLQALDWREEALGPEHPSTLISMNNLATVFLNQGKYEAAEEMHQRTLCLMEKVLGPEHPDTLTGMNNLASVLRDQGKYKAAEEMHQQTLCLKEKTLGPEHQSTLTSMNNLASVLHDQGKYQAAKEMHQQTLCLTEKALGPEHPDTLASMNNLALVLCDQGKYEAAEEMHQQTLCLKEKTLGPEHQSTLVSMNNLALVLCNQGKYKAAEEMHRRTLSLKEKTLGPEHPDTLASMNNLASVLRNQGKYEVAGEMHQRTLCLREKALGPEHPNTLASMDNLALVLHNQGKYGAAGEMHQRTLCLREKALGPEHPDTLVSMNNLALVLCDQGKYEAAEEMHRRTLCLMGEALGPEHPDTLASMNNLALVLHNQGKYEVAEEMHRRTLSLEEKTLGLEHQFALVSMNNLASVFCNQGKYEAAEEMHRRTLGLKEKALGPEHPDTLASMDNLASVLRSQGKHEVAGEMHQRTLCLREKALGPEHPSTLNGVYCLAYLLQCQEQYDNASIYYQRACSGYRKTLGLNHPTTLKCSDHYSSMLNEMRQRCPDRVDATAEAPM